MRNYIVKVCNACISGPFTVTGGQDLLHTLPIATTANQTAGRSAIVTKIMCYNNSGANVTLRFGTLDRGAPTFVQLLPTLVAINGLDNEWLEFEIPAVEWISWPQATAAGRTGDMYVIASAAGPTVMVEIKEFGQ